MKTLLLLFLVSPASALVQINGNQIVPASIDTTRLAPASVDTTKVVNGGITTIKISASAVDTTKLAPGSVDTTKLVNGAVGTNQLAPLSINTTKLAAASVDTTKLVNGAVGTAQLQILSVGNAQIASAAVDTTKLAPGSVDTTKIANGSVDSTKIAPWVNIPGGGSVSGPFSATTLSVPGSVITSTAALFNPSSGSTCFGSACPTSAQTIGVHGNILTDSIVYTPQILGNGGLNIGSNNNATAVTFKLDTIEGMRLAANTGNLQVLTSTFTTSNGVITAASQPYMCGQIAATNIPYNSLTRLYFGTAQTGYCNPANATNGLFAASTASGTINIAYLGHWHVDIHVMFGGAVGGIREVSCALDGSQVAYFSANAGTTGSNYDTVGGAFTFDPVSTGQQLVCSAYQSQTAATPLALNVATSITVYRLP